MKLQTMLLPTGEFVLIAQTDNLPGEAAVQSLASFREAAGAVAFLVINEPVEVENALIDENAVRSDFWTKWDDDEDEDPDDGGPDGDDGERQDLASVTYLPNASVTIESSVDNNDSLQKVTFAAQAQAWPEVAKDYVDGLTGWDSLGLTDAGDQILAKRIEEGAEFSPAGLVKSGAPRVDTAPKLHEFGDERLVRRDPGYTTAKDLGFTIQPPTADLLTLSRYFTSGQDGVTQETEGALARLANPEPQELWAGPPCPCWPTGAAGYGNIARCMGCPEAKYDAPDPTAS